MAAGWGCPQHFVEQKPRQKKSSGSGPWGAATITPVPPVWPEPCLPPNGHGSVGEDAWGTLVTCISVYPHFPGAWLLEMTWDQPPSGFWLSPLVLTAFGTVNCMNSIHSSFVQHLTCLWHIKINIILWSKGSYKKHLTFTHSKIISEEKKEGTWFKDIALPVSDTRSSGIIPFYLVSSLNIGNTHFTCKMTWKFAFLF